MEPRTYCECYLTVFILTLKKMSPWAYVLLVLGLLLVVLVILQLAGVPWPSTTPSDYTTDAIIEPPTSVSEPPASITPTSDVSEPQEKYYQPKGYVREQAVCQALEAIYERGFPTVRPPWLLNPATGQAMEYDCYNADLHIAAEHNGIQHYQFPSSFHKTEQEFLAQRARDEHKRLLSDKNGVTLITVPYWVPFDLIPEWVRYYTPENIVNRQKIETLRPPKT